MFTFACQRAAQYTFPIVVCARTANGEVHSGIGAGILISASHALTAAHVLGFVVDGEQHKARVAEYDQARQALEQSGIPPGSLKAKLRKLDAKHGPENLVRDYSVLPLIEGRPTPGVIEMDGPSDLAVIELDGVPKEVAERAATLQPPDGIHIGASMMRLGYPFHEINATYDEAQQSFVLSPEALPVPIFANEGMIAQEVLVELDGARTIRMIRTTSPGLRGQTGGPLVDRHGVVWGVQSTTAHLPLGFTPRVGKTEEHQFLNVGQAVHTEVIADMLQRLGVSATWANPLGAAGPLLSAQASPLQGSSDPGGPTEQAHQNEA